MKLWECFAGGECIEAEASFSSESLMQYFCIYDILKTLPIIYDKIKVFSAFAAFIWTNINWFLLEFS